jgi:two-component system nitrogen regulation response regulator NtrX
MPHDILIVDDEADIRAALRGILEDEGYTVREASSVETALQAVQTRVPDLAILDVWLKTGERDGLELLIKMRKKNATLPVLMISGHGTIETAVAAMRHGAYDFIEKPFQADRMIMTIERLFEADQLRRENRQLREQMVGPIDLLGGSSAIHTVRLAIEKVAPTNSRVFLTGAAGTGKEVVARMIHRLSPRAAKPFVVINCALAGAEQLENELFGSSHHPGMLHHSDGGTLFLDEVIDLPPTTQAKLLRVLQDHKYQHPVTGAWIDIDCRMIASSTADPLVAVGAGQFREDLFYRLNVVTIKMPTIAERRDDVPVFLDHFMRLIATQSGKPMRAMTPAALAALQLYDWPGNTRQLKNVAEWLMIMAPGEPGTPIDIDQLPPEIHHGQVDAKAPVLAPELLSLPLREAREVFERSYLQAQVARFGGSVSRAAAFVEMERSALHRKLRLLGLMGGEGDESGIEATPAKDRAA